jgi:hypothetical protein
MGLTFEVCHVDCIGCYCCRRFHFSDRCQSRLTGSARRDGCSHQPSSLHLCRQSVAAACASGSGPIAGQPCGEPRGTFLDQNRSSRSTLRKASGMTDEQLALQAVSDAQRILEEYLEPRPRNNERIILDKLVEVLERPDLLVAVDRMQRSA